ncbi:hypothetical protein MUP79_10005 [Candidatus Bathyarchaeota archaeon]|nr:hypothetical protein [Candidatus Bathyarchaeota archaeon]
MSCVKAAGVLFLALVLLSGYSAVVAAPDEASIVGARKGDWAMYMGAPPSEEYEWIRVSVLHVNGSTVDLEQRFDLRTRFRLQSTYYYPDHPHYVSINVEEGTSNFYFFLVPRNLTVGDLVPVWQDHVPLKIEGVTQREYAGAERTVVYASFSNMSVTYAEFTTAGRYYWDRETGLLVERVATLVHSDVTTQLLTGTNLWSPDLRHWIAENYLLVIMLVFVLGAMTVSGVLLLRLRKRLLYRVTHTHFGIALLAVGIALGAAAIVNMTSVEQSVTSLCFAFAPFFLVSGVIAYTGAWVTLRNDRLVLDKGVILIAAALILGGIAIACLTYRELAAIVPYIDGDVSVIWGGTAHGRELETYTSLEAVLFYPYVWLASALQNVIICLAGVGFIYKVAKRF